MPVSLLKIGDILALIQASGRSPVFRDCWNNIAIDRYNSEAHSFRTLFGMLSGPDTLLAGFDFLQ